MPSRALPTTAAAVSRHTSSSAATASRALSAPPLAAVPMNVTELAFTSKLDSEIRALKKNFTEAVSQARLGGKDRLAHSADEVQLQHRAMSILKSAHSLTAQTRELKEILLLSDTAARHALLAQRASSVTEAHARNHALLVQLASEATEVAAELDACLWEHCDPLPGLSMSWVDQGGGEPKAASSKTMVDEAE